MATFKPLVTVPAPTVISTPLGDGEDVYKSQSEIGKAVKLGTGAYTHVLATNEDEIDGFITSINPETVNGGYSFGGVQLDGRVEAIVGPNQGATDMAIGDYVLADDQFALGSVGGAQNWTNYPGTAPSTPTGPTARVITGTPTKRFWRCIYIVSGEGGAGSVVLLERS